MIPQLIDAARRGGDTWHRIYQDDFLSGFQRVRSLCGEVAWRWDIGSVHRQRWQCDQCKALERRLHALHAQPLDGDDGGHGGG